MINFTILRLLSSVAFTNPGAVAMAAYKETPDPSPLISAIAALKTVNKADIEARSHDIGSMVPYWDKTDDIIEGYDAILAGAERYLPKFHDESEGDYQTRLKLTKFTNIYRDIVEGLSQKPFEEEITFANETVPKEIEEFVEDVDGSGNNWSVFSATTFFNGINSAIDWIFIDYPTVDNSKIKTKADQKQAGLRPFWSHVLGRNVYEVRTRIQNGKRDISYIRIYEPVSGQMPCFRVFEKDENGKVSWALYQKIRDAERVEDRGNYALIGSGMLSIDVIPMVPFITGRRDGSSWKFFPAMRDAADLQIKHYQAESALEFTTIMAGYPMLAANGFRPQLDADGKPLKVAIGPNRILWGIPDGNGNHGTWAYVEPSAQTLEFQQKKIDKTEQNLRELGRQPLTATSGNLTVITTAVAAGKARSAVSAWALALKDALENALVITCKFLNISGYEPEVNVYTEFDSFVDSANDMVALQSMRDNGDISQETLWFEARRRKILSPEFDGDKERARLLDEVPNEKKVDLENSEDDKNMVP